jgi:predicted MPP superfamily phosphohydrolase
MFGAVLSLLFALLLVYVLWRSASVPLFSRVPRWGIVALGIGLGGIFLLGRTLGHGGSGAIAAAVELVGMTLLGWVFLVSLSLLVVDLLTLFGRAAPRRAPWLRGGALAVWTLLAAFALVQGFRAPAVVSHEVTLPGLPPALDGTVIVAVSDAHIGSQLGPEWFSERLGEVAALEPDLIVFLGDMFEGHGDPVGDLAGLSSLRPPLGAWFVEGNHDTPREDRPDRSGILEAAGVRRLVDQWAEIAPGLVLAGVRDLSRHRRNGGDDAPLDRALAGRPAGATVLLSHSPLQLERAAGGGVGLMLSGHTHGGQIWPFGVLVRTVYPVLAGRQDVDGMTVIVSRGMGTWGPRMRLWRRGEILRLVLRAP